MQFVHEQESQNPTPAAARIVSSRNSDWDSWRTAGMLSGTRVKADG
jgi:hypothetical protein